MKKEEKDRFPIIVVLACILLALVIFATSGIPTPKFFALFVGLIGMAISVALIIILLSE
jgi:amino acid permease